MQWCILCHHFCIILNAKKKKKKNQYEFLYVCLCWYLDVCVFAFYVGVCSCCVFVSLCVCVWGGGECVDVSSSLIHPPPPRIDAGAWSPPIKMGKKKKRLLHNTNIIFISYNKTSFIFCNENDKLGIIVCLIEHVWSPGIAGYKKKSGCRERYLL